MSTNLTLGEAVKRVEVSRSTLQRRLRAGEIEGATHTPSGEWSIPYASLIAAGLIERTSKPDPQPHQSAEVERLRLELAHTRHQLDTLRALAEDRLASLELERARVRELSRPAEALDLDALAAAVAARITAPPPAPEPLDLDALALTIAERLTPRRRWWTRKR